MLSSLNDDLRSLGLGNLGAAPGPPLIRARRTESEDFATLSIRDPYPTHDARHPDLPQR